MFSSNSAGALCPRYGFLCALAFAALVFSPWVAAAVGLSISGTPATTVLAGRAFDFQPSASGALTFSISNRGITKVKSVSVHPNHY